MIDLLTGNVIEWRIPEDIDLEGVEFKAMASGSHTLRTDFVYVPLTCDFKGCFGLCVD